MKRKVLILSMALISGGIAVAQCKLHGSVIDAENKELLPGASIQIKGSYTGTQSDSKGNFVLRNIPKTKTNIEVKYLGYKLGELEIEGCKDTIVSVSLERQPYLTDPVIVSATRVSDNSPTTYSNIDRQKILENNLGQDITYIMSLTPSVVVTSDAGTGIGYTGIRIRGSDPTRVNVTINGIPYNDAESSGTFWVNIPDILSSVDNIQIQRGVGTSTNGAGAFGGSINIQTSTLMPDPYAQIQSSAGSFNTLKNSLLFGTGLSEKGFVFDGRVSKITSDGYIDRAYSDLKSYYLSGGYYGKKTIIKLINFSGLEKTYQAWYGVPYESLQTDRTFNPYTYENQIDHYQQDNYQLTAAHEINRKLNLNLSLHYTYGRGYYEEYNGLDDPWAKTNLAFYGIAYPVIGNDTVKKSDIIRRRWLNNDFYGAVFSANYNHKKMQFSLGSAYNEYVGKHFGEVIWARFAGNSEINHRYYDNDAKKTDMNVFGKTTWAASENLSVFVDMQYRIVTYDFLGYDSDLKNVQQQDQLGFFNPKAGMAFNLDASNNFYLLYAVGNKEPNRNDYVKSSSETRPRHENLHNIELGYRYHKKNIGLNINFFNMDYKDQLVLTGQINDVGAYTRTNVGKSYRRGIEIENALILGKKLEIHTNASFSDNRIPEFVEYIDDYDTWEQKELVHNNTHIAFSPSVVAGSEIRFVPLKGLSLSWFSKYVGEQYLDNTSDKDRMISAFFVNDCMLSYSFPIKQVQNIRLSFKVNNILNELYESNGWVYPYLYDGSLITERYYYPQATRNYMFGLSVSF